MIQPERIRRLNARGAPAGRFVLYWMQASQRACANHALEHAARQANALGLPLQAFFALTGRYPQANRRHYAFLLQGLAQTQAHLARRGVPLVLRLGEPEALVAQAAEGAALVVTDRGYTRTQAAWRTRLARRLPCPLEQVESDLVVPLQAASAAQEYSAATLRPRLLRRLEEFLVPLEPTRLRRDMLDTAASGERLDDPEALLDRLAVEASVPPVASARGGPARAAALLRSFLRDRLPRYADARADITDDVASHLGPYLHFGQISPLAIALAVRACPAPRAAKDAFLEQLIVRRELAANFVHYCPRYDSWAALPAWARATLQAHRSDRRRPLYRLADLEAARTHDPAWNAAMREMIATGALHNTLRMYWGKQILAWSATPRAAFRRALHLNNKYFLDGRGPNAFANVAWCFGLHDRPWPSRPIFGSVRCMNASGLARKYDVEAYLRGSEG